MFGRHRGGLYWQVIKCGEVPCRISVTIALNGVLMNECEITHTPELRVSVPQGARGEFRYAATSSATVWVCGVSSLSSEVAIPYSASMEGPATVCANGGGEEPPGT